MARLTQEQIDAVPGLAAAQRNGDVVFLNLDTDDTTPRKTEGFTDAAIRDMDVGALEAQLRACNREEENIHSMLADVRRRRESVSRIMARRKEIT